MQKLFFSAESDEDGQQPTATASMVETKDPAIDDINDYNDSKASCAITSVGSEEQAMSDVSGKQFSNFIDA